MAQEKKELRGDDIRLITHYGSDGKPKSYELNVGGGEFLYYNKVDLLAGFLAHVGMSETNPMDKGTILSGLFSAMLGDAYADAVTTLKQRVGLLTSQYNTTITRMDDAIDYVTQAEKQIDGFKARIKATEDTLKSAELLHAENKKDVGTTNARLKTIEDRVNELNKQAEKVFDKLTNILTVQKAIEDAKNAEKGKKTKKADTAKGDKKTSKDEKPSGEEKKSSRKTRDEKIIAAIEKKAAKNKDIK